MKPEYKFELVMMNHDVIPVTERDKSIIMKNSGGMTDTTIFALRDIGYFVPVRSVAYIRPCTDNGAVSEHDEDKSDNEQSEQTKSKSKLKSVKVGEDSDKK